MADKTRRVTTYAEWQWDGERYVLVREEGYDYEGPWALAHDVTAVWASENYKFYNDDGTDAAAENTNIGTGNFTTDDTIRLRMDIGETAGADPAVSGNAIAWEYRKDGGTWTSVGTAGTEDCFVAASANITNGAAVTTQLLSGVGNETFQQWGDYLDTAVSFDPGNTFSSDFLETEISLGWNAAGTYEYRLTYATGTVPGTSAVAQIVVDAPSQQTLKTLPASATTSGAVATETDRFRTKTASATTSSTLAAEKDFFRTKSASATTSSSLATKVHRYRTHAASATTSATVTASRVALKTLTASATTSGSLATIFTKGKLLTASALTGSAFSRSIHRERTYAAAATTSSGIENALLNAPFQAGVTTSAYAEFALSTTKAASATASQVVQVSQVVLQGGSASATTSAGLTTQYNAYTPGTEETPSGGSRFFRSVGRLGRW